MYLVHLPSLIVSLFLIWVNEAPGGLFVLQQRKHRHWKCQHNYSTFEMLELYKLMTQTTKGLHKRKQKQVMFTLYFHLNKSVNYKQTKKMRASCTMCLMSIWLCTKLPQCFSLVKIRIREKKLGKVWSTFCFETSIGSYGESSNWNVQRTFFHFHNWLRERSK